MAASACSPSELGRASSCRAGLDVLVRNSKPGVEELLGYARACSRTGASRPALSRGAASGRSSGPAGTWGGARTRPSAFVNTAFVTGPGEQRFTGPAHVVLEQEADGPDVVDQRDPAHPLPAGADLAERRPAWRSSAMRGKAPPSRSRTMLVRIVATRMPGGGGRCRGRLPVDDEIGEEPGAPRPLASVSCSSPRSP